MAVTPATLPTGPSASSVLVQEPGPISLLAALKATVSKQKLRMKYGPDVFYVSSFSERYPFVSLDSDLSQLVCRPLNRRTGATAATRPHVTTSAIKLSLSTSAMRATP